MKKEEILQDVRKTVATLIQNGNLDNPVIALDELKFDGTYPWTAEEFYVALTDYMSEHNNKLLSHNIENFFTVIERDKNNKHIVFIVEALARWISEDTWPQSKSKTQSFFDNLPVEDVENQGRVIAALLKSPYSAWRNERIVKLCNKVTHYYPEIVEALSQIEVNQRLTIISKLPMDCPEQNFQIFKLIVKTMLKNEKVTYDPRPYRLFDLWRAAPLKLPNSSEVIEFNRLLCEVYKKEKISLFEFYHTISHEFEYVETELSLIYKDNIELMDQYFVNSLSFEKYIKKEFSFLKVDDIAGFEKFNEDLFYFWELEKYPSSFCHKMLIKEFELIKIGNADFFQKLNSRLVGMVKKEQLSIALFEEIIFMEVDRFNVPDAAFFKGLNQELGKDSSFEEICFNIFLKEYVLLKESCSSFLLSLYVDLACIYFHKCDFDNLYLLTAELLSVPWLSNEQEEMLILTVRMVVTLKAAGYNQEAAKFRQLDPLISVYEYFNFKTFAF